MRSSSTFVPGPTDTRTLGVMLDSLTLSPAGIVIPPRLALARVAVASATVGVAAALLGVTPAATVATAHSPQPRISRRCVAHGFGPYTDYADVVVRTVAWTAVATIALAAIARWKRRDAFRNTAKFALSFTAAAFVLELLALFHPNMPIGDALFQAHRFQEVLAGHYYFTSLHPATIAFRTRQVSTSSPFPSLASSGAGSPT